MTDESTTDYADARSPPCSTTPSGAAGYYGTFGANMHTDNAAPHPGAEAIVVGRAGPQRAGDLLQAAARPGPTVATRRPSVACRWNAGTLTFVTTVGAGANGLQTMLPCKARPGR